MNMVYFLRQEPLAHFYACQWFTAFAVDLSVEFELRTEVKKKKKVLTIDQLHLHDWDDSDF